MNPGSDVDVAQAARELVIAQEPAAVVAPVKLDSVVDLLAAYKECQNNIEFWKKSQEKIKARLADMLGEATVGTIAGEVAVTYERIDRLNTTEFRKKYPNLWKVYQRQVVKEELDVDLIKSARPDLYAEFQVRSMRVPYEAPGR